MDVEIRIIAEKNSFGDIARERLEVYVDGVFVAGGGYGGEPEDNCRCRDYAWVEKALKSLSETLGATVRIEEKTEN